MIAFSPRFFILLRHHRYTSATSQSPPISPLSFVVHHASIILAGRTAFNHGGSRGIGLEIGKSLASRGCNVVIAAKKTATPHPKLPGNHLHCMR